MHIVLAVTDPSNPSPHKRHSLVVVEPKSAGVNVVRPMMVFGYDDAPEGHCEVKYDNVKIDVDTGIVGGRAGLGNGFAVGTRFDAADLDHPSSSRVGLDISPPLIPGLVDYTTACAPSVSHLARSICSFSAFPTQSERHLAKSSASMVRPSCLLLYQLTTGTVLADIAKSRAEIDQARLLVLSAARRVDMVGAKGAMKEIGVSKVSTALGRADISLPYLKWHFASSTERCRSMAQKASAKTRLSHTFTHPFGRSNTPT